MNNQEYLERLVFCCARVPNGVELSSDVCDAINCSMVSAMLPESHLRGQDIHSFHKNLQEIMKGDYYGLKWPEDYAHLYGKKTYPVMHHDWFLLDGKYEACDLYSFEMPNEYEMNQLNHTLANTFPEDFSLDDFPCKVEWRNGVLNDKHCAACQSIRKSIIERHIRKIVSELSAKYDFIDLALSIPKEVEPLIPHYIELIIRLSDEKCPNTKVRTSFTLLEGETIAESCQICWQSLCFSIKPMPNIDETFNDDSIAGE